MTSRSNRNTGSSRAYRGSGCVGRIPISKPGDPNKDRRRTKPQRQGKHTTPFYSEAAERGRQKQFAIVERAWKPVRNRLARAVHTALRRKR